MKKLKKFIEENTPKTKFWFKDNIITGNPVVIYYKPNPSKSLGKKELIFERNIIGDIPEEEKRGFPLIIKVKSPSEIISLDLISKGYFPYGNYEFLSVAREMYKNKSQQEKDALTDVGAIFFEVHHDCRFHGGNMERGLQHENDDIPSDRLCCWESQLLSKKSYIVKNGVVIEDSFKEHL